MFTAKTGETGISCGNKADIVFINGSIYTMDEDNPRAEALAVKDGRLIFVGSNSGALELTGPQTKIVNLEKKNVIPGLIEGHMHYASMGQNLLKLDAFWKFKEDILAEVKAEAGRLKKGEWILGHGWNQEVWPGKQFPTKEELDEVSPDNPVVITRACMHAVWVNSKALEAGGVTKDTVDPVGGEILRNDRNEPIGILVDTAIGLVTSKIPQLSRERQKQALLKAQEEMLAYGFTSCADAGTSALTIELLKELYESGELKLRIYSMLGSWGNREAFYEHGPQTGLFNDRLTIRCVKLVADGSLGARSAWMLEEYSDRPGHCGSPRYSDERLYKEAKEAIMHGFQVAIHAIGDAAVNQCLNTYERIFKEKPVADHRCRIEHFQVARPEDIERTARLGIIPAMQTVHHMSDVNMVKERIGQERLGEAYAWRKVINSGNILVNGSDAPIEPVNPYRGIYAAITRTPLGENSSKGCNDMEECNREEALIKDEALIEDEALARDQELTRDEALTREEALKSFTIWAARGQFEEDIKGSLKAGKLADFAVIDRDIMTCAEDEIMDVRAEMTVIGGEIVYTRTR